MLAALGFLLSVTLPAVDDAPARDEALLGTWVMVAVQHDGVQYPESRFKGSELVFERQEFMTRRDDRVDGRGIYKLVASKTPKEIDRTFKAGVAAGKAQLGIYEVKDDTLRLCMVFEPDPRPTTFESPKGARSIYWVYKKKKD